MIRIIFCFFFVLTVTDFVCQFLLSFSILSNSSKILSGSTSSEDSLNSVHGLRFLSFSWVVLVHTYLQIFAIGGKQKKKAYRQITCNTCKYCKKYKKNFILTGSSSILRKSLKFIFSPSPPFPSFSFFLTKKKNEKKGNIKMSKRHRHTLSLSTQQNLSEFDIFRIQIRIVANARKNFYRVQRTFSNYRDKNFFFLFFLVS